MGAGGRDFVVGTAGHVRCPRPIFPLDRDVPFTPEVELYARARTGIDIEDEVRA